VQRLVVRADGWKAIGAGHLMRCLALAHEWRQQGGTVTFVTHCDSDALAARLAAGCDELVRLLAPPPSPADLPLLAAVLGRYPGAPVVLDGYGFDATYHDRVRVGGHPLLVIDDHAHLPSYNATWVLNQNAVASPELYRRLGSSATLLLGPSFSLLRGEFAAYQDWTRPRTDVARRVLVTLGGSDPDNVTAVALRAAAAAAAGSPDATVRVIAGHSNPNVDDLRALAAALSPACEVVQGADDMPAQMVWADLAISAAGTTSWELAYMQLPALLITTADNQGTNAAALERRGVARDMGRPDAELAERVARAMAPLMSSRAIRARMARAGRALVDGRGAGRVVAALASHPGDS